MRKCHVYYYSSVSTDLWNAYTSITLKMRKGCGANFYRNAGGMLVLVFYAISP